MNDQSKTSPPDPPPIWAYVPVEEYTAPSPSISSSVRGGIVGLWQKFKPKKKEPDSPLKTNEQLELLPPAEIDCVAPDPDWNVAAAALNSTLADWMTADYKSNPAVVIIGQPYSANNNILKSLAAALNVQIVSAPTADQILSQQNDWMTRFKNIGPLWVLPNLEKCFLRHPNGLTALRQFITKLNSGVLGKGILGCDSWAWAYLTHVFRGALPDTLVAQAFDNERLSRWLSDLAHGNVGQHMAFRQTDNGALVLSLSQDPTGDNPTSTFISNLAAFCRGNPGLALKYWRQALRSEPGESLPEKVANEAKCAWHSTIWVSPWEKIDQLSLPSDIGIEATLMLHNLLLHDGLPLETAVDLLPFTESAVHQSAHRLKDAGIVENDGIQWRVSASSYPIVRQFLEGEGYLTDML